ncbi:hypothetical protein HYE15_00905 [Mycoplasmopsis bovis]|nr:hypothetical protein [Mycoplasmopsis bovis]QQH25505.1 hypothetical protein HYE15_00905 [Mycoplasmopsis bovis]
MTINKLAGYYKLSKELVNDMKSWLLWEDFQIKKIFMDDELMKRIRYWLKTKGLWKSYSITTSYENESRYWIINSIT